MRTFIIRARKGSTQSGKLKSQLGNNAHIEVVAHTVMNAFYISNNFRTDVEVYIVLDSAKDFPRTIKLCGKEGLSFTGFHEQAIIDVIETTLIKSSKLQLNETILVSSGVSISGFGFEKLLESSFNNRTVYLLDPKGESISDVTLTQDPVFILSDHIPLPKNIVKSLKRKGAKALSLGKQMLFASQCVTIIHYEMDKYL